MTEVELTISSQRAEPSPFRLIATLGVAGMISGLALSSVYQITDPIIRANNQRELEEAVLEVVPGAAGMQEVVLTNAEATKTIYAAYDGDDLFLGYAIEGSTNEGFAGQIRLIYGYDPSIKRVVGMKVLESLETPGLGDKIKKEKNPAFAAQFENLAIEPTIVVVKDGKDQDNEIDAITGATISSNAVVDAINTENKSWLQYLPATPPAREERDLTNEEDREAASGEGDDAATDGGGE
ncbi:MAG: RnfABCDGE type electron transport complex subunit G [Phycisphaerales bacterium]|nr:MAG: RnfABCDGE type electron transport complex subunit G [Phycisphaerales bacterium]